MFGGKYLEIAQHEAPCDFLEGVAQHFAKHVDKLQIYRQYLNYDIMIQLSFLS